MHRILSIHRHLTLVRLIYTLVRFYIYVHGLSNVTVKCKTLNMLAGCHLVGRILAGAMVRHHLRDSRGYYGGFQSPYHPPRRWLLPCPPLPVTAAFVSRPL